MNRPICVNYVLLSIYICEPVFQTLREMYNSKHVETMAKQGLEGGAVLVDSLVGLHFLKRIHIGLAPSKFQRSATMTHPVIHGIMMQGSFKDCALNYAMHHRLDGLATMVQYENVSTYFNINLPFVRALHQCVLK